MPTGGTQQSLSRRQVYEENTVNDYGLNAKINPAPRLAINLDADYTESEHNDLDFSIFGSTFADSRLTSPATSRVVIDHKPLTLAAGWATPNPRLVVRDRFAIFP